MDDDAGMQLHVSLAMWTKAACNSVPEALRHLRQDKIPHAISGSDIESVTRAIGSLRVLRPLMIASAMKQNQGDAEDDQYSTPKLIHAAWNDIWQWMSFLHTRCIMEESYGDIIMRGSLQTIPYTLKSFGWHQGLRRSMTAMPALISLLTCHWLKEDTYINQPDFAWHERHFCLALEHLFTHSHNKEDEKLTNTIVAAAGSALPVARIALRQFHDMLKLKYLPVDLDSYSLSLVLIFYLQKSHPIRMPFFAPAGIIFRHRSISHGSSFPPS